MLCARASLQLLSVTRTIPSAACFVREKRHRGTVLVWHPLWLTRCLLYTSDAADDTPCVDLGGRRIIKKRIIEIGALVQILQPSVEEDLYCFTRPWSNQ